jgi:hypothetical protein
MNTADLLDMLPPHRTRPFDEDDVAFAHHRDRQQLRLHRYGYVAAATPQFDLAPRLLPLNSLRLYHHH